MCGIFATFDASKAAECTVVGLHGIQHRAIDFAGVVSSDGRHMYRRAGKGLARQVFSKEWLDQLHGKHALGHLRYPTVVDDSTRDNTQPIMGRYNGFDFALAHNGNLTNTPVLQVSCEDLKLATSMDSEYIVRILELYCTGDIEADLARICAMLDGSYALVLLLPEALIALQDPTGNRPLSIGNLGDNYFLSSETCAFGGVGATHIGDVEPGTIVRIDREGLHTKRFATPREKHCRFEGIYYTHPSSTVFGDPVSRFRSAIGEELERLFPVPGADIVTPVPDSSNFMAMGFAESKRSGVFWPVIIRSHYVGRSFIAATQAQRDTEVAGKFTFSAAEIKGKRIVVLDDSIVRGTTLPKIVGELRRLGAKEIHVRIGSPPILHPCRYGINTPTQEELISARMSPDEICALVGADSLQFLPLESLKRLSPAPESFCYACMNGQYW